MANTISPNMGLIVPTVASEPGPEWAQDINASLSTIDQHNHSAGQGVQIQPNGLNINADLPFNSNNATILRSVRFAPQVATLNLSTDIGCLYVVNNELYYNDVTGGHMIQVTLNGSVNAGAGSITGLPSGTASASYSAGTFVFQSATSTSANIDGGSYVFRNNTAGSNGVTVNPPASIPSNYGLFLPTIPGTQSFLTLDASGNIAPYASISQGIQRSNLAPVGQQNSASCGVFTSSTVFASPVRNLSVTITTSGRPVMIFCQSDASGSACGFSNSGTSATWGLYKNGASPQLAIFQIAGTSTQISPPSSILYLDNPTAGTYTYNISVNTAGGTSTTENMVLVAYEL
jgi:hypothetical protein